MVVGSPELVMTRCKDLSQELINRDLHFVVGDVVLSYHQAMVVPHSPFLMGLIGRVNERVQTVHLDGVTAAAVIALMEFIYTGACIVTAQFASEVQQAQRLLQFQVEIESFVLAPKEHFLQISRGAQMEENAKLQTGKKRQMGENVAARNLPKKPRIRRDGTKVKGTPTLKIKKEKVDNTEHAAEMENQFEETNEKSRRLEEVVKTIGNRSNMVSPDEAGVVLPEEGSKEYRAHFKKVKDRLWKRRIREGVDKPFITKKEVEREMVLLHRESRSPKTGILNAEKIRSIPLINDDAGAFSPSEEIFSPSAKYESELRPDSPKPTFPAFPFLPMNAFKTELMSPVAQLASKVSMSVAPTPFDSTIPGSAFSTRTPPTNTFVYPPTADILNTHFDQHIGSQDRLFQNQRMDFPHLMDPNLVNLDPPPARCQSDSAQNGSNMGHVVDNLSSSNIGSNMENVYNINDLWNCLPYAEEGFSFGLQYDNVV